MSDITNRIVNGTNEISNKVRDLLYEIYYVGKKDGYAQAIDDAVKVIEDSKSIFDNSRHSSMGEKDRLQNLIKKLKAGGINEGLDM